VLIHAYGLFWRSDEVDWWPKAGSGGAFQLLGRVGKVYPALQVADFRTQHGIYVLYNDWGSYYVGLASTGTMGRRLRSHTRDKHAGKWDRFSWFGFDRVLTSRDVSGLQRLKRMPLKQRVEPAEMIRDLEATLIHVMPTVNRRNETFKDADEWRQVERSEKGRYLDRVARDRLPGL